MTWSCGNHCSCQFCHLVLEASDRKLVLVSFPNANTVEPDHMYLCMVDDDAALKFRVGHRGCGSDFW